MTIGITDHFDHVKPTLGTVTMHDNRPDLYQYYIAPEYEYDERRKVFVVVGWGLVHRREIATEAQMLKREAAVNLQETSQHGA